MIWPTKSTRLFSFLLLLLLLLFVALQQIETHIPKHTSHVYHQLTNSPGQWDLFTLVGLTHEASKSKPSQGTTRSHRFLSRCTWHILQHSNCAQMGCSMLINSPSCRQTLTSWKNSTQTRPWVTFCHLARTSVMIPLFLPKKKVSWFPLAP